MIPDSLSKALDAKEDEWNEERARKAREEEELTRGSGAAAAIARRKARRAAAAKAQGETGPPMDPIDGLQAGKRLAEVSGDRRQRRQLLAGATNAGPSDVFGSLGLDFRKTRAISPGRGKKFETFSVRGERLGAVDLSILATYLPQHAPKLRKLDASWCPKFDAPRFRALEESLSIAARHRLQELDVSYCRMRNLGAAILARSLCGSKSLRVLRAAGCLLGASEAPAIAAIMLSCPNIKEMHLAQNDFRPSGARSIEAAVLRVAARQVGTAGRSSISRSGSRSVSRQRVRTPAAPADQQTPDGSSTAGARPAEPQSEPEQGREDAPGSSAVKQQ